MIQPDLFSQPPLHRENNAESQSVLIEQHDRLKSQCEFIYEFLKSGNTLTVRGAMLNHNISHLPRRVADLAKKGIVVQTRWAKDGQGRRLWKEYYIVNKNLIPDVK